MVSRSGGPSGLNMVPNLSFEGIWLEGETNLADGEWHHLVWTFAGKFNAAGEPEMTCYCDGKPEELLVGGMDPDRLLHWPPRIDTVVDHEDSVPLILGGSLLSIDDRQSLVPGELDEVYVIEGAIDAVAARRLFLENRYEPAPPKQIPLAETQAAEK